MRSRTQYLGSPNRMASWKTSDVVPCLIFLITEYLVCDRANLTIAIAFDVLWVETQKPEEDYQILNLPPLEYRPRDLQIGYH